MTRPYQKVITRMVKRRFKHNRLKMNKLTPHQQALAEELSRLPEWQRETLRPLIEAANTAHRFGATKQEFIDLAITCWYSCDPADLPSANHP